MTFHHATRSRISYVVLCLLAVQMTSTMRVVCYLNVLEWGWFTKAARLFFAE